MPHIGVPELVIILVAILIIFGVGKLPQIGGALGKGIRQFKQATRDDDEEEGKEDKAVTTAEEPKK